MINVTVEDKQKALMVRYLLGLATKEERTQVEERYFSDSEYFDQLLALEDSLIDDFVTGRMPVEQRSAFKEAFRLRKEDVRFASALIQGVTKKKPDTQITAGFVNPVPAQRPWRQTLSESRFSVAIAVAALVLLAISLALALRSQLLRTRLSDSEAILSEFKEQNDDLQQRLRKEQSQSESSAGELEIERKKRIEADSRLHKIERPDSPNAFSEVVNVVLGAAFIPRGTGTAREIRVAENIRWLRFEVSVKRFSRYESYRITIKPAGQTTAVERASLNAAGGAPVVVTLIPAKELKPGDYILTLYGEQTGLAAAELEQYSFRIIT